MKLLLNCKKNIILLFIIIGNTLLISDLVGFSGALFDHFFSYEAFLLIEISIFSVIIYFLWKKWTHPKMVMCVGAAILIVVVSFLYIARTSGSYELKAYMFMIILLFIPFQFAAKLLGPIALIYAYYQGLMSQGIKQETLQKSTYSISNIDPDNSHTEHKQSQNKKYILAILGGIMLILICWPFYYIFNSGTKEYIVKEGGRIGEVLTFKLPLAYSSDCTGCGGSKRDLEINRNLECIEDIDSVGAFSYKDSFYNVSYVPSSMKFELVEIINIESHGLNQIGGSGYRLGVLKDENGLLSTMLYSMLDRGPCINTMTAYLRQLFLYLEKIGMARIQATVFDLNTNKSDESAQQFLINALNSAPKQYTFTNIKKTSSTIPGMLAVEMEVNADALVYLIASSLDYKIWSFTSLDKEYQKMLTPYAISEMNRAPRK